MNGYIRDIQEKAVPVLKRYGVKRAALFGSYAQGRVRKASDVDLLVDIGEEVSLLDFVGLKIDLETTLERNVDLVEYGTLKPLLRDKILRQQIVLL